MLASLTALAEAIPPFQLAAMTFAVGTLVGLIYARLTRQNLATLREVPIGAWALGVFGLFGYHACYFFALQRAPALEASLVNYLWPLLIVVFSGFLPAQLGGKAMRWWHLAGATLGFAGTILILMDASGRPDFGGSVAGYGLALAAALIWSSYSVASRLYQGVPSIAVLGSCAATAIGATVLHLLLERWVWPTSAVAWVAIAGLGLGPVGLAFYLWDEGMKRGDLRLLGAAAYATPLFSTIIMAGLGLGRASPTLFIAALLVTGGALLAAKDTLWSRPQT